MVLPECFTEPGALRGARFRVSSPSFTPFTPGLLTVVHSVYSGFWFGGGRGPGGSVAAMSRPTKFEEFRYVGDKRSQVVYDLDTDDSESVAAVEELMVSEQFLAFAPDTLEEARNRGYRPHRSIRRALQD
jgi:hypothetical protein